MDQGIQKWVRSELRSHYDGGVVTTYTIVADQTPGIAWGKYRKRGIPQQHILVAKRYATYLRIVFICFVVLLMSLGLHRYAYIVHTVPNRWKTKKLVIRWCVVVRGIWNYRYFQFEFEFFMSWKFMHSIRHPRYDLQRFWNEVRSRDTRWGVSPVVLRYLHGS